jgi:hypothetical protein
MLRFEVGNKDVSDEANVCVMRNVGKVTIQLLDGTGYGSRIIEIGNWVGRAFFAPKSQLSSLLDRDECGKPGVYCLKYIDPENGREIVYIGEADCLSDRLRSHLRDPKKNSFLEAVFFISHTDWLTKTQVKYLEHRLVEEAHKKSASIHNRTIPNRPNIQTAELNDLEDFLDCILLLLPIMGYRFMLQEIIPMVHTFEVDLDSEEEEDFSHPVLPHTRKGKSYSKKIPTTHAAAEELVRRDAIERQLPEMKVDSVSESQKDNPQQVEQAPVEVTSQKEGTDGKIAVIGAYRIVAKNVKATMDIEDGFFVVRKGSQAKKDVSASIHRIYLMLRDTLIESGVLVDVGEFYEFTADHKFTSASAASNVVIGRQSPGPRMWVDQNNRSLRGIVNDRTS